MIICNLAVLLAERKLKISKVSADTSISRTTLTALYYNEGKGIQYDTANLLCIYLGVNMGELFTVLPFDLSVEECQIGTEKLQSHETPLVFRCRYLDHKHRFTVYLEALFHWDEVQPHSYLFEVDIHSEQNQNTALQNQQLTKALQQLPRKLLFEIGEQFDIALLNALRAQKPDAFCGAIDWHVSFPTTFTQTETGD